MYICVYVCVYEKRYDESAKKGNVDEVIGHLQEREAIECRRIEKGFTLRAEQRSQS